MIESVMYAAIGFLAATLLALLTLPAVWNRAVRLTRRRVEGAIPVTLAEIQADKDEQRAAFALQVRQLELQTERLQARTAEQWTQITRQAEELRTRQAALDETTARLDDLQSRYDTVSERERSLDEELTARTRDLDETRIRLNATISDLAAARLALGETVTREEELRVEHVTLSNLRDTLEGRIGELERKLAATQTNLEAERSTLRATSEKLSAEATETRELRARLAEVSTALDAARGEADTLTTDVAALTLRADQLEERARSAEFRRDASEREASRISGEALAAQRAAQTEARQANDRAEMLAAEKAMLEGALAKARTDRAALQQQIEGGAPAVATASLSSTSEDTALLRERISEIAGEVAHLTAELEGPGSPIHAMLAAAPPAPKGKGTPTLVDRIRALQERTGSGTPATIPPRARTSRRTASSPAEPLP